MNFISADRQPSVSAGISLKLFSASCVLHQVNPFHKTIQPLGRSWKNKILNVALVTLTGAGSLFATDLSLWYRQPATVWDKQALPIGNSQMGAMIFGGVAQEHLQFNEESLWIGDEEDTGAYQAFGDVFVEFDHAGATNYIRQLDLQRAVHTVTYESGGVKFRREAFASFPAKVVVYRFTADKPGALTGAVSLTDMHKGKIVAKKNLLTSSGSLQGYAYKGGSAKDGKPPYAIALQYEAQVVVLNDGGTTAIESNKISFKNASSVTLLLAAGTDFKQDRSAHWRGALPHDAVTARLEAAAKKDYAALVAEHLRDYQRLFDRVTLNLDGAPAAALPTDLRLKQYSSGKPDLGLEELMFQYGRYLLISASREGGLPANLQGKWNNKNHPAWRCDYHTDVNLEMNYWLADVANLGECFQPFADWIQSIRAVRREATKKEFGTRGWILRGESGLFGGSTWNWTPGTSAWFMQNSFDHYAFTRDKEYLRTLAYPAMKEICEFWIDRLKELPDGTLVAPQGYSPEHGPVEDGVAFEQQLIWDLFNNTIEAADALGTDKEFRDQLAAKRAKLLGPKIGKWGQLQEWMVDRDDPKDHHRHTSHLIAVYPGRQISVTKTPELAKAAAVSLDARGVTGDSHREWAFAWRMSIWARLANGDKAHAMYENLLKYGVLPNLFCTHPPFQMDGNFGCVAGVCEMLLQSQTGEIELLPALPSAWPTGKVSGLRARGGYEVNLEWKNGKLMKATVKNISGDGIVNIRYGTKTTQFNLSRGEAKILNAALE